MTARGSSKPKRSVAARYGAGIAAGCTALVLLLVLAAFLPPRSTNVAPPTPGHWFDDRAGMVSPSFASAKSTYLYSYLVQALHYSVLVVIEPKAPAGDIQQYTTDAASTWKIGAQGADNGVVLFVFPSVRKARLEVGYGLEGAIPDVDAKHLLEETLVPQFSAGRYEDGFEDFLAALVKRLQEHADEAAKRDKLIGIVDFAIGILKQVPRLSVVAWDVFRGEDFKGRVILTVFGAAIASAFVQGLSIAAIGVWALVQLPWRIAHGQALRTLDRTKLAAEFAPAQFARRPPPSLIAVAAELHLVDIVAGAIAFAGIVVGIAFLGLGSESVMEGHGTFSGAGSTVTWVSGSR